MTKKNEEIKTIMIKKARKLKKMKDDVEDNTKLFEYLQAEITDLNLQSEKLNDINKTLNHMISELHEASENEFRAMKLEMEAMKADKATKDEQHTMLYIVMESHMGIDRRIERERRLAEEATQRKKVVIVDTQEAGGSPSHVDVEMSSTLSYNVDDIIRRVLAEQRRKKAKEQKVLLLRWKDEDKPEGNNDDDDQGSSGLLIVNPSVQQKIEDFLNDEINEQEEDQHQESSSSGKQHANQVFLTQPTVIYLHARYKGELEVPRSRAEMLEELGLDDGKFKFDIEDEIPPSPEREYEFKYAQEADQYNEVIVEEASDSSDEETDFHYSGVDETFPSLAKIFNDQNEDEIRRKIVEKITTEGVPRTIPRENLAEERKKWFKVMPMERKFIRPLQYFEFLSDIKTLPWWDINELVQTKNIKQFYYGLEVKQHDKQLWDYAKQQEKAPWVIWKILRYPDWKPQYPKQIVTILENGKKDITFDVNPPRCLKNKPLRAMKQDFYEDFEGRLYNETTTEAVISLFNKSTGKSRRINVLDPMWLVNCSKKDIDCLFYNKIVYEKREKVQSMQYQKIVDVCFAPDINSGRYWKFKWRDLEIDEFLKKYKREQRFKAIAEKAAKLEKYKLMRPPPMNQKPIEKEEKKIPKWDRKHDADAAYRKWWIEEGRFLRRKMLEEKTEQRRQRAKERIRKRKD
ncbi:hypothetical protein Hanom_Chr03g00198091 [Helianthus anomalus]